ncbi:hypothetical protein CBR_g25933 [Chara braunii]|uniref:Reverse transcriptase n=1 Tax=Chara braunii TaxID=69332 RepID=A0A388L6R1_CHABU|nr:hypothetical protein CBR_g25933 [Chara braunii]|eukprot:GBG78000.1 hypothetical protein CBR_g25933 [Chara braunii]
MPFGLTNAPTTFQAAMTNEFRAMLDRFVLVYLDDILVYSRTLEEHLDHLRRVLETLRRAKFKANRDKCEFVHQELKYLGHFTPQGISPLSDKIQVVQDWPESRNVTDVRSFLGLAGYYQRFIKGYSKIVAHLTKLQCEDRPFDFGTDARESFLALKAALLFAEVLRIYDPLLPTRVTTDASSYGIGAVLEQHDGVDWHPVEYFSKKVSAVHSIDDARKKELLAFVHALERWRHFLLGRRQFRWATDNNPLVFYKSQDTVNSTIARWMAFIDQFDFFPDHIPGKSNRFADALSRRPDLCTAVYSTFEIEDDLRDSFIRGYQADPEFRDNSTAPPPPDTLESIARLANYASAFGGPVSSTTSLAIASHAKFADVANFAIIVRMANCDHYRSPCGEGKRLPWISPGRSPSKHKTGVDGILTVVDRLTKFTMFLPCRYHAKAPELAEVVYAGWIQTKGYPKEIVCDCNTRFMSDFWLALIKQWGSSLKPSLARHPQTDGQTERAHQTAQVLLRTLIRPDQKDWVERLPDVELAYNSSIHPAIGMSSFEFEHGSPVNSPLDTILPRTAESDDHLLFIRRMQELLVKARDQMAKTQQRMRQQANRQRLPCPFRAGDRVWVSAAEFSLEQDISRKLLPKWMGPWPIVAPTGDAPEGPSFIIQVPAHLPVNPVFHRSKLALYTPAELDDFPGRQSQDPPSMDGFQEVGDIISQRRYGNRPTEFLVHFAYCTHRADRWLTRAELQATAPDALARYEQKLKGKPASSAPRCTRVQALQPGEERRLIAERRARALAAGLQEANRVAREQATAARAAAMANSASSAALSSASSLGTNGTHLGMPLSSTSSMGTSGSTGSRQSSSQMAGSQFSPLTPRERELREIQQVERLRQKLEEDLKKATDREREIKNRAARLDNLEADKAELEGLDESALTDPLKVLKKNMLSLHAHVDSRLDFMQSTLDQILDALTRPGFRPPAQSPLPLSAMSGPFPVQAGTQPSGTSAAVAQTVASSSSGLAVGATPPQQPVQQSGQPQGQWYPKTPMKPPLAFSGEGKGEELNTWLRTVPVWVKAKRTLLKDEVVTAASYLEGKAAKWLDGVVIKAGYGRRMADWAKSLTLDQFMEMVEAQWHNPQEAQKATDAINKLDQRKFKSVRELTTTVESLILVPGINYSNQFLLTTFVRCLPENIRNLLASEARVEYHSFETLYRKALDLEATLGNAQPTSQNDSKKKKSPQEWKKKGAELMMVESDGTQTEIDELSDLVDYSEYNGEEVAEGSTLAAVVKAKAGGRGKGQPRGQGKDASNQTKQAEWVKAGLDQNVWRDRRTRGACINCGEYGHLQYKCQNAKDGKKLRPIEYMSKKMPSKKLAKSTYERELYALYKALVHWRHFLLGRFFYLRIDHQTLKWIKTQPTLSDTLKRWIEVIDQYDFKLEYLKGEYNKVVDALSRRVNYLGALVSDFGVSEEVTQSLVGAYQEDPVTMDIIRKLQAKDKATESEFVMVDGLLYLDKAGIERLVVPSSEPLRSLFLGECHDATGHFGYKKTSANLVQRFWWPGMFDDAKKYVETCQVCQRDKPRAQAPLGLLKPLPIPVGPGQSVSTDFMDTLVTSKSGKRHIFVIIDRFTKYARLVAMPETARTDFVIKLFKDNWYEKLEVVEHMKKAQQAMIASENQHRRQSTFQVGKRVWVKASELGQEFGISRKLMPQYFGPWEVLDIVGDEMDGPTYVVRVPGHLRTHPVFHASKLAPFAETDQFPSRRSMLPPTMDGQVDIDDIVDHRDMPIPKPLGRGRPPKPKREYRVRFRHHTDPKEDRWFTREELIETVPQVVEEYERLLKGKAPAK